MDEKEFDEFIDGVKVHHTGEYETSVKYEHKGYKPKFSWEGGGHEDLGYERKTYKYEKVEMFNENGDKFYSNSASQEKAQELVEELKKQGKDAVIGPQAPATDIETGKPFSYPIKGMVGVYIVEPKELSPNEMEP